MKKQLLSVALILGASSSAVLAHQYLAKNASDGFALFTFYNLNNKIISDFHPLLGPGKTFPTNQTDDKVGRVVVQYVKKEGVERLKSQGKGDKMSSFVRENGVGSGTFTFTEKDGITFKPDLATKASDTWEGLKSRFK